MKKVFLIHGFNGSPNSGWLPWMMAELKQLKVYASALTMLTPERPRRNEWITEIARWVDAYPDDEIYLVGHSLGSAAILNYLQLENRRTIQGVVLVSGRCQKSHNPLTEEFYESFDFEKIKTRAKNFVIIHGDNDTIVPVENAYLLGEMLQVEPIIIPNGGHFTTSEGWTQHPLCLEKLKELMNVG